MRSVAGRSEPRGVLDNNRGRQREMVQAGGGCKRARWTAANGVSEQVISFKRPATLV